MKVASFGLCLCLIAVSIETSFGQKFSFGSCPALTSSTSTALTFANLVGTWYEYARYHSVYQHDWKCVSYAITAVTAQVRYSAAISGSRKLLGAARATAVVDIAGATQAATSAAGTYLRFTISYGGTTTSLNYYIIATDDATYLALYGCQNVPFGKIDNVLLLAKTGVTQTLLTAAYTAIYGSGISRDNLMFTYTDDCVAK